MGVSPVMEYDEVIKSLAQIKHDLVKGKAKNKEGLYEVPSEALINAIIEELKLYRLVLTKNPNVFFEQERKLSSAFFLYNDLETDFIFERIVKYINEQYLIGPLKWLDQTRFIPRLSFHKCKFGAILFDGKQFNSKRIFSSINIHECSIHRMVLADGLLGGNDLEIYINKSVIENLSIEKSTTHFNFENTILFRECDFLYTINCKNNCIFDGYLRFQKCVFSKPKLETTMFHFNFINTVFNNVLEFTECEFNKSPNFHGAKLSTDTSFYRNRFFDLNELSAVGNYRQLKQIMQSLGAEHDSLMFHALEMEARKNTVLPRTIFHHEGPALIASFLLRHFNDYGRNYWRPWIWLLGLILVGMVLYLLPHGLGCNPEKYKAAELWQKSLCDGESSLRLTNEILASLIYSLQHSLGPIGLIIDNGLISAKMLSIKTLSVLQMILSSIFWYLIIVQLRRQFKL